MYFSRTVFFKTLQNRIRGNNNYHVCCGINIAGIHPIIIENLCDLQIDLLLLRSIPGLFSRTDCILFTKLNIRRDYYFDFINSVIFRDLSSEDVKVHLWLEACLFLFFCAC